MATQIQKINMCKSKISRESAVTPSFMLSCQSAHAGRAGGCHRGAGRAGLGSGQAPAAWGGQHNVFTDKSLAGISVPKLFVSGNLDDVSGYAGIQSLYQKTQAPSTYLLTMINARHNIAPHPAPIEAWESETDFGHYYEPAWSSTALNDINRHFVLAMMDCHVKNKADTCDYLNLSESSDQVQVDEFAADDLYLEDF